MTKKIGAAGRGIVLDVTPEIINVATVRDSSHCVIADALRAALPQARAVTVDLQTIRFTLPEHGRRYVYLTPPKAQAVLVNFDQEVRPEPFTMRLGYPAQILRAGKGTHRKGRGKGKPDATIPPGQRRRVKNQRGDGQPGQPTILGGRVPPPAALSNTRGRRRAFGLKTLKPNG